MEESPAVLEWLHFSSADSLNELSSQRDGTGTEDRLAFYLVEDDEPIEFSRLPDGVWKMFSLNRKRFTFDLDGVSYVLEMHMEGNDFVYRVDRNGTFIHEERQTPRLSEFYTPYRFEAQTPEGQLRFVIGTTSLISVALEVHREKTFIWRSSKKPFKTPERARAILDWLERQSKKADLPKTPERCRHEEEAKWLRPALIVDIVFAAVFFFVARDYGLVTAALSGACATLLLVIIDRVVKPDLTGGFAVFGAVMALISAGLAVSFQDELVIKLRGSIMGLIMASFAFLDWRNGGRYLGVRFARYFYVLGAIDPKRASLAVCVSGLLIVAIDTPLAFILTTNQWIWYNAFLDSLIAVPILFGAMWFARER